MRRPFTAIVLAAGLLLTLTGCGKGTTLLGTVKAAAATTTDSHTVRMSGTMRSEKGILANGVTYNGVFDFDHQRARFDIDPKSLGLPIAQNVEGVFDYGNGAVMIYIHLDMLKDALGTSWVKLDLGQATKSLGVDADLTSILQKQSGDPTSGLRVLRGATKVDEIGRETVRGVATRHVRATVDVDKAAAESPASIRADMQKLADLYKVKTRVVDVWLDNDGRVRRFRTVMDPSQLNLPTASTTANPTGTMTVTYEMYDFGVKAAINVPPAGDVADMSDLMNLARRQAGGS